MAIDPEVIPPTSSEGFNSVRFIPKWAVYALLGVGILIVVGILKALLPLIVLSLILGFVWKQATK